MRASGGRGRADQMGSALPEDPGGKFRDGSVNARAVSLVMESRDKAQQ